MGLVFLSFFSPSFNWKTQFRLQHANGVIHNVDYQYCWTCRNTAFATSPVAMFFFPAVNANTACRWLKRISWMLFLSSTATVNRLVGISLFTSIGLTNIRQHALSKKGKKKNVSQLSCAIFPGNQFCIVLRKFEIIFVINYWRCVWTMFEFVSLILSCRLWYNEKFLQI